MDSITMDEKIKALKDKFRYASEGQITLIDKEMHDLATKQLDAFSKAMLKAAKDTAEEAAELVSRTRLKKD